ncbi:hypothetical protein KZZ52_27950 [Dactylosporangium sp. AC04546]|uniref:hypothetical protein n=1 Tax=Dactylosporangium sp. AC04546 TaxID=2862460 RepID=UPI001EDE25E5|nr:hypothetical protein [Dactylosporangium sp. AC04546]WVK89101.1 hypothetical protein KZZ52_27950 [Dactylosporangium sp. AC04546]
MLAIFGRPVVLAGVLLSLCGAAACGGPLPVTGSGGPIPAGTRAGAAPSSPSSPAPSSPAPTPAATAAQPAGGLVFPAFAYPFTPASAPFGAIRKDVLEITYYEVGRATTKRDSTFHDRETGRNIWPAGSPVVYVELVVTNVGASRVFLGVAGPHPLVTLKSLDYLGGVSNLAPFDTPTADRFGVHQYGIRTSGYDWEKGDHFPIEPGQSIAQAVSLPLRTGETYRFTLQMRCYERVEKADEGRSLYFDAVTTAFR